MEMQALIDADIDRTAAARLQTAAFISRTSAFVRSPRFSSCSRCLPCSGLRMSGLLVSRQRQDQQTATYRELIGIAEEVIESARTALRQTRKT
jgi:hypothetical protein